MPPPSRPRSIRSPAPGGAPASPAPTGDAQDDRTPAGFFRGFPDGLALFDAVHTAVAAIGPSDVRVTRSQIAFRRGKGFAYVWRPGQYVHNDVPAVLSIALPREVPSERFRAVAHPAPGVWMHHLELSHRSQVDDQVHRWLEEAYENAR